MAEFKVKLKLTGLEIEIEGSHEDLPLISQNISEQISGLLSPSVSIIEGDASTANRSLEAYGDVPKVSKAGRKPSKPSRRANAPSSGVESTDALAWRHDDGKFGTPKQDWKVGDKFLWLLLVVEENLQIKEYSARGLANTFNKQFRQAGTLNVKNAVRDIGYLKAKTPALVGEDVTSSPSQWFLTEAGKVEARKLIAIARGEAS